MENLILNRYRPLGQSTQGGFSTVEVAWDTRIQRRVAIKRIDLDGFKIAGDTEVAGLTEARTAAMLDQENIVNVYDFEIEDDAAYLIMEFVDGITLAQLMRDHEYLSKDIIAAIFEGVAHALEAAHENQVLHLDIKPDNILIDRAGKIKVTDFGLAQLSHEAGFGRASGGTIGYMPLEQMRLEAPDERTDEWALAAIVYQMLTHDNPFMAHDVDEAMRAIEQAQILVPSLQRDDVTEMLDQVLFKALSLEKEDRYPSVLDFAIALRPHVGSPKRGARMLSDIISQLAEDMDESDTLASRALVPGALSAEEEIVSPRVPSKWFAKIVAALSAALMVGISLQSMPWIQSSSVYIMGSPSYAGAHESVYITVWLGALCAFVVGLISTRAAALVAPLVMSLALLLNQNYIIGAALMLATLIWWGIVGRTSRNAATVGISSILFGAAYMTPVLSLVSGFNLSSKRAVATTLYAACVALVFAAGGSMTLIGYNVFSHMVLSRSLDGALPGLLANLAPWLHALSWTLSALVVSLLAHHKHPFVRLLGVFAGALIVIGTLMLAHFLTTGFSSWIPPMRLFVPSIVALVPIAMAVFAFSVDIPQSASDNE